MKRRQNLFARFIRVKFNVVTDACLPDALHAVDLPAVLAVAGRTAPALQRLVTEMVRRLDEADLS